MFKWLSTLFQLLTVNTDTLVNYSLVGQAASKKDLVKSHKEFLSSLKEQEVEKDEFDKLLAEARGEQ